MLSTVARHTPLLSLFKRQRTLGSVTRLWVIQLPTIQCHSYSSSTQGTSIKNLHNPQKIATLPLDNIYICDANLVISHIRKVEPWSSWVELYLSTKKEFFVPPIAIKEVNIQDPLPKGFVDLSLSCEEPSFQFVEHAFSEIAKNLGLTEKSKASLENDIKMLLSAGYCVTTSTTIGVDAVLQDKVHFITGNTKLLKQLLKTSEKRALVETAISRNTLEHLISVIGVYVYKDEWEKFE